ncbi:MAG: DUF5700 domain-containing putative Zn-dependent protease, partial [Candidatus Hodarchaeota archaeon]
MLRFNVDIDFSFINQILDYFEKPSQNNLKRISRHKAAKGVYSHALRFNNTKLDLEAFWEKIILREAEKIKIYHKEILACAQYIESFKDDFKAIIHELTSYFPEDLHFDCKLYLIVGYDIGIVSESNAFLNIGFPLFHEHKRELLYFAMHELHHVGYTFYHPIYSLEDLKTTSDLLRIIKYSTHLEGLAVYAPLHRRLEEGCIAHKDYQVLAKESERLRHVNEFFSIFKAIKQNPNRPIIKTDYELIERLAGDSRLWYITGAHMAETIDKEL